MVSCSLLSLILDCKNDENMNFVLSVDKPQNLGQLVLVIILVDSSDCWDLLLSNHASTNCQVFEARLKFVFKLNNNVTTIIYK